MTAPSTGGTTENTTGSREFGDIATKLLMENDKVRIWEMRLEPGQKSALHKHEKRVGIGVLFAGTILFAAGVSLAFFVVVPLALPWLFDFGTTMMIPLITAEEYFSFVFTMVLTFGVSFELPIVVLALSALGIVTPQLLSKYRRHAVVMIVIAGAFLTPGDLIWTTIALAVPLYGLYELSVAASFIIYKRKQRRRARLEAEQAKESEQSEATA